MKEILGIELSHQKAPLAVREGLSIDKDQQRKILLDLQSKFEESFLISTCNRLSLYCFHDNIEDLLDFFRTYGNIEPYLTILDNSNSATRHLFSTASGLESQAIGEHEILGQIRNSFLMAQELGNLGPCFNELIKRAITTGKRVRKETAIGQYPVSLASVSLDVINQIYPETNHLNWLVLGTGEMATLMLKLISKKKDKNLYIASKTKERADTLAKLHHGKSIDISEVSSILPSVDVVIGCTHTDFPVITKEDIDSEKIKNFITFIDLGLPRNFDIHLKNFRNIKLFDLDDLKSLTYESLRKRQEEVPKVLEIISDELNEFEFWKNTRNVAPVITEFYSKIKKITSDELKWALPKMGDLNPQQKAILESVIDRVARKIAGKPVEKIKEISASKNFNYNEEVDVFIKIFDLDNPFLGK